MKKEKKKRRVGPLRQAVKNHNTAKKTTEQSGDEAHRYSTSPPLISKEEKKE